MPNLVLEKGGQTYRFKLHEDKSVTHNKFVPIPFNGKDYYARYGDTSTPLITEVNGVKHFVQYEPVDFQTVTWEGNSNNTRTVFIPSGKYKITMEYHSVKTANFTVESSGYRQIVATLRTSPPSKFSVNIQGLFNDDIYDGYGSIKYRIERMGD